MDGKKNGQGTKTWSDGRKYVGKFLNGFPNGQGTDTSPNGWRYLGKFKDGKKHGQGKFTSSDGGWYIGSWIEGQSWTGKTYDKDGKISYEKKNGEIQYKK